MNKPITSLLILACFCFFAHAEEPVEVQRIQDLSAALQSGGLPKLSDFIKERRWHAPRVPSKWSVENRSTSAQRLGIDFAGREFGQMLAVELDSVAPSLQDLLPGDELDRLAHLLCDLSDWCASTPGYGNLFLAQRCLDLASVGLARRTASLDVLLVECEKLASRMSPVWMSVDARARTLNSEAGTNLFMVGGTQAEMEKTWGSGGFLMREKRSGRSRAADQVPGRGFIETPTLKANLDFFEPDGPNTEPLTLVHSWNSRRYERIVNGLELQNVEKALALLKFRSVVGRFPDTVKFTEKQLQEHEQAVAEAVKYGIKVSRMDERQPQGKAAFEQAWDQQRDRTLEDHTLYATAWRAYNEVKTGQFLDEDTRAKRMAMQMATDPAVQ